MGKDTLIFIGIVILGTPIIYLLLRLIVPKHIRDKIHDALMEEDMIREDDDGME